MGGPAMFSGSDFQSSVIALIAVHILGRQPLNWVRLSVADVPVALSGETGGPGDDVRVEFAETDDVLEVQAKAGLTRGTRLNETFAVIASRLPAVTKARIVIAVDPSASDPVKSQLRKDLRRIATGRTDALSEITEDIRVLVANSGGDALLSRVDVVVLDLEYEADAHRLSALSNLRRILDDEAKAEAAWDVLYSDAARICRDRERRRLADLAGLLSRHGIHLKPARSELLTNPAGPIVGSMTPLADRPALVTSDSSAKWHGKLDVAKDLINQANPSAALAILTSIERELQGVDVDPMVRARLHVNKGAALIHLESIGPAADQFNKALEYDPTNSAAMLNLASVALWNGKVAEAMTLAERVLSATPDSQTAWVIKGTAARMQGVNIEMPAAISESSEFLTSLGQIALFKRQWSEAREFLARAVGLGGRTPVRLLMLATATYNVAHEHQTFSKERLQLFAQVERLSGEAIDVLNEGNDKKQLSQALSIRGAARRFLGKAKEAEADLARAAALDMSWETVSQRAALQLEAGHPEVALDLLDQGPPSPPPRALLLRARILIELGRIKDARAYLREAKEFARESDEDNRLLLGIAEAAIEAGFLDDAQEVLAEFKSGPAEWIYHQFQARIATKRGEPALARAEYVAAIDSATSMDDKRVALIEYANLLHRSAEYPSAIELYEKAGAASGSSYEREQYARSLYAADLLAKAAALLDTMRAEGPLPYWALELSSFIAQQRGDAEGEIAALEAMLREKPASAESLIRLAYTLIRTGQPGRASPLLRSLREAALHPIHLMQLAELSALNGEEEHVLPAAFQAVRKDPGNEQLQLAYLNLMLKREQTHDNSLEVDTVGDNTHVKLGQTGGPELEYLILSDTDTDIRRNEFKRSDSAVRDLIGKRVGDSVVRNKGQIDETSYSIKEIKHAFVHMFQDIFLKFSNRFPDSTAIKSFRTGESPDVKSLAPMIASVSSRNKQLEQALTQYELQLLPLGVVAFMCGSTIPQVMDTLSYTAGKRLLAEWGHLQDLNESFTAARDAGNVVITRSALETSRRLSSLENLRLVGRQLLVPKSLIEELDEEVAHWEAGARGGMTHLLSEHGDLRVRHTEADEVKRHLNSVQELRAWVKANTNVILRPLNSFGTKEASLRQKVGSSSFDSLAIAKSEDALLFADDLGLRGLGKIEWQIRGFSTYSHLVARERGGTLSSSEFHHSVSQLIALHYSFIPLNAALLHDALRRNAYVINDDVATILDLLRDPNMVTESAVRVIAQLVRELALSPVGAGSIRAITLASLENLSANRPVLQLVTMFLRDTMLLLKLLPQAQETVKEAVHTFLASKLSRKVI